MRRVCLISSPPPRSSFFHAALQPPSCRCDAFLPLPRDAARHADAAMRHAAMRSFSFRQRWHATPRVATAHSAFALFCLFAALTLTPPPSPRHDCLCRRHTRCRAAFRATRRAYHDTTPTRLIFYRRRRSFFRCSSLPPQPAMSNFVPFLIQVTRWSPATSPTANVSQDKTMIPHACRYRRRNTACHGFAANTKICHTVMFETQIGISQQAYRHSRITASP